MSLVDYASGDISIKKVENGWVLIESHHEHPDRLMYTIYESDLSSDSNSKVDDAHSLFRLISDAFDYYLVTSSDGGMILDFNDKDKSKNKIDVDETNS